MTRLHRILLLIFPACGALAAADADFRRGQPLPAERPASAYLPDFNSLTKDAAGGLRQLVEHYIQDRDALLRYHSVPGSDATLRRSADLQRTWLAALDALDFERLESAARIDWHLLRNHLSHQLAVGERAAARNREMNELLPFAELMATLQESRRSFRPIDHAAAAGELARLSAQIRELRAKLAPSVASRPPRSVVLRAAQRTTDLVASLRNWFEHYNTYDPQFGWWMREPQKAAVAALEGYAKFLREKLLGQKEGDDEPIVGDPIGAEGLRADLANEMIPYTPEELIAAAEKEFAWCEAEWRKVARDLGLGDDWKAALERIKRDHVAPGEQPALIAEQAYEAIAFVTKRDLVTVPPHAIDTFRMTMMSPERQKIAPFFLGGETIQVSFPTDTMDHAGKLDSLRANNRHFCRATVHHELIPGHHLQGWHLSRFQPHRQLFSTPFWIEGWALWWEFQLWDLGFPRSPEERGGMLFWRSHRCARILFSLNFHLGRWTPEQCIDFLVERVGHDRHTATGEVRRSFNGSYSPLYQVAYMMGAIQLRALHAELVKSGRMEVKDFHDRILRGGPIPIELVRANLTKTALPKDHRTSWRFLDVQP
ncbi:MAG: DUF885 domain-containing protein [Opitutaceae bacterium]